MNAESVETQPLAELPTTNGWSWKKIFLLILLAFAGHFAFVYLLGTHKHTASRTATNVPVLHLADNSSELVQLTDPTLFALPHADAFAPANRSSSFAISQPSFRWPIPTPFVTLNADNLGAAFKAFMQTNRFPMFALNFKPEPQPIAPEAAIESALPKNSTYQLAGELAGRRMLNALAAPTLTVNDVIAPSRIQLLVDKAGMVVSTVLLKSSENAAADQQAMALAYSLQFAPAEKLMFGEIIFNWHTVPASTP